MEEKKTSGKTFGWIVLVQLAGLGVLLGIWGYRRQNASPGPIHVAEAAGDIGKKTPSDIKPASNPSPRRAEPARKVEKKNTHENRGLPNLRKPSILIEKSGRRLTVLDGGQVVKRYPASLGGKRGDKVRKGDLRTPEGVFYVCLKNPRSKYVLSLGLSYPNIKNAERGLRDGLIGRREYDKIFYAIGKGRQPPWDTKLGGEIMIHGDRRGGRYTQGCIALENDAIRELYRRIPLGTKVIITP